MKKYISLYLTAFAAVALSMASCSKDTEGLTWVTYYPDITLDGGVYTEWTAGTAYVDPGYTATLDGEDITSQVEVVTSMNLSSPDPGFYKINYQVANKDGITASATRYVLVTDPSDPISGYYTSNTDSFRDYSGTVVYFGGFPEYIVGYGDGTYFVSDMLGGWYQYRAGYGVNYAMQGYIAVEDDGTVELLDSYVPAWGDSADYLEDGAYDTATSTITYTVGYAGIMDFYVSMTKN